MHYECGGCGAALVDGASFCGGCGLPVVQADTDHANRSPLGRRVGSWAVDLAVIFVVVGFVIGLVEATVPGDGEGGGLAGAVTTVVLLVLPAAYLIVAEALWGRTLGKLAVGLRVAAVDGRPALGWRTATIRHVGRLASLVPAAGGYIAACTSARRTWHDMLSGTVVIDAAGTVIVETGRVAAAPVAVRPVAVPGSGAAPEPAATPVDPAEPGVAPPPPPVGAVPPQTLRRISEALARRGHVDEAADVLVEALQTDRSSESAEWCDAALLLVDAGRGAQAIQIVNQVLLDHPGHARAEAIRSLALNVVGPETSDEALASAEAAFAHDPTDPLAIVALAFAQHRQGRHDRAEALLDGAGSGVGSEAGRAALCRYSIALRRQDAEGARRWAAVATESQPFNTHNAVRVSDSLDWRPVPKNLTAVGLWWWSARGWFKAFFDVPDSLTARTDVLVDALTFEPQDGAVQNALRTIPTFGDREPNAHLRLVAFPYGCLAALFTACVVILAPPAGVVLAVVVAGAAILHVRAQRAQHGLLSA